MEFNANELVDVVNKVLTGTSLIPTWDRMGQWELESNRHKLRRQRASQYGVLQILNAVHRSALKTKRALPEDIRPEHLSHELAKLDETERRNARAFINELDIRIRQLNVAYTVVASSWLLADSVIYRQEGKEPPMLKNEKRRWYKTTSMCKVYGEMLRNSKVNIPEVIKECRRAASLGLYTHNIVDFAPEPDFESYKITGKAIVYAGTTAGGWPVLLSLDCTFDLNGVIDGLPEGYRVIMFKPRTATITKKWARPKFSGKETIEDLYPAINSFMGEHGLKSWPTTCPNHYVISGFERCPDSLARVDYDPDNFSVSCAVVSMKDDTLLKHVEVKTSDDIIKWLTRMVAGDPDYTF